MQAAATFIHLIDCIREQTRQRFGKMSPLCPYLLLAAATATCYIATCNLEHWNWNWNKNKNKCKCKCK